uniref:Uncharacterized protein n=1 Tax=Storeatula sp. CCMP1868 TaxID=195070 RepID=A0A222AHP2_9CRYP|nr:hypothetical protein [Storeatula sp. CCMP1868]
MNTLNNLFLNIKNSFNDWKLFLTSLFITFTSILIGFFLAIILSTLLGQTGDWGVLSSGILVALLETISKIIYTKKKK